jgi:hypothetical protein
MAMPPTSTLALPQAEAGPALIQQIYITHCLYNEGLYRQAGFSVRACSTQEPLLLRFAVESPPHELPAGLQGGKVSAAAAPRRLALVRIPGGQRALIHSVGLPEDSGRANNFFSHLLFSPDLGARAALATWAAPNWTTRCEPGSGIDLPPLGGLPGPGSVNDDLVTAFLQPEVSPGEQDLATLTCPARLAKEPERRRELLALAVRGCLLALQAGPLSPRGRFFLVAEPGLVALLLYAVARFLPEPLRGNLTFSTYENPARDLRLYRHAQVVGTYTGDAGKGLDEDFFTARGYALDTFAHKFSPELKGTDATVAGWIDLAAGGEWATMDKVHTLLGKTATTVISLKEGLLAARLSRRLAAGQTQPADLLTLKRFAWGQAILDKQRAALWPVILQGSLTDEKLREEFADVLRKHLPELEQRAVAALRSESAAEWQQHWKLLWFVLEGDPPRLRETFQRLLSDPAYPPALRFPFLQEVKKLQLSPLDQRLPLHGLLRGCTAEDLAQFARSDLPREWFVWALCYALVKPETREAAARHLHDGDDALVRAFWEQFKLLKDESQRRAILAPLFPAGPAGADFLSRLLRGRHSLRPDTTEWVLTTLRAFEKEWVVFWSGDDHLGLLLDMLRPFGDEAAWLWERLAGQINQDVLPPGDPFQKTILMNLAAGKDRPGPAIPPHAAEAIDDWARLREHFERASTVPEQERQAIIDACKRRQLDPIEVLAKYFERFLRPRGAQKALLDDFAGFFHSFYLEKSEYQDCSSRLIGWLRVVSACPEEERAAFQAYYLENCVPLEFRWRLAEEMHQAGKLLTAVFETVPRPAEGGAGQGGGSLLTLDRQNEVLWMLSGATATAGGQSAWLRSLGGRLAALLVTVAGGFVAAYVCGLYRLPLARVAGLALFVPLVVSLAEGTALQSVALFGQASRRQGVTRADWLRLLGQETLAGALLGVTCGLVAGGVTLALGWPARLPLCLGVAVAAGGALAPSVGLGATWLLSRLRRGPRPAAGPVARAVATTLALWLYFSLAGWLLR